MTDLLGVGQVQTGSRVPVFTSVWWNVQWGLGNGVGCWLAGKLVSPDIHPPPQGGVIPMSRWVGIEEKRSPSFRYAELLLGVCGRNPTPVPVHVC